MSLSEVERVPVPEMLDAETGEMVSRSDTGRVAKMLNQIRAWEIQYRAAKAWCNDAILEAMDREAKWTLHYGNLTITAPSPTSAKVEWDTNELLKLRTCLSKERVDELMKPYVAYKPDTVALHNAAKLGGPVAEIINAAEIRTPARRYASVKVS